MKYKYVYVVLFNPQEEMAKLYDCEILGVFEAQEKALQNALDYVEKHIKIGYSVQEDDYKDFKQGSRWGLKVWRYFEENYYFIEIRRELLE